MPGSHAFLHGEKVAFGVLVQLMLEKAEPEQVKEVLVMKNVLVQEWTDRLTAALERRDKIWSVASALTEASFKVNRSVAGNLGYQIFQ